MPLSKWEPEKPSGKVTEGVNPALVMGITVVLLLIIGAVLFQVIAGLIETGGDAASSGETSPPSIEVEAPPASPTTAPTIAPTTAPTTGSSTLPSIRGYVLFGARTFTVSAADVHISNDRNKIVILLHSGANRDAPPLSMVLELKPGVAQCDENGLARFKVFVDIPSGAKGGGALKTKLVREPGAYLFPEILNLACTRAPGSAFSIDVVGSDEETRKKTGLNLNYGFVVKTTLR